VTRSLLLLTWASLFSCIASSQSVRKPASTPIASGPRLTSIRVTGSQRYSAAEIIAASGLKVGDVASEDAFKKATQELGDTGLFTNISYSFAFSSAGTKLDLQLADNEKLVPARFENFVWLSDQDLVARIRQTVPLFSGMVPVGGNLSDQVSDALQALLLQHAVSARAEYIREGAGVDGPIDAINFRASGIDIRIREITFPGTAPSEQPALADAAKKLEGMGYLRSQVTAYAKTALLPVYFERGFLKAAFSEPQAKVSHEDQVETKVDVALPANPGLQYKISGFAWEGNQAFPADRLQSLIHLQPAQPANALRLKTDLGEIQKLYGTAGYMTASVNPDPQFDDAASSVAYKFQVQEGEVFHLGELEFQGVDTKTADRLREAWALSHTLPYDNSYPQRFIEKAWKLLPSDLNWTVSVHEAVNEKDQTVDVALRYGLKPPL
jgi:outer membrane protein assembly factor BamA